MGNPKGASDDQLIKKLCNSLGLEEDDLEILVPSDGHYNCIAWAADDLNHWWEPNSAGVPRGAKHFWPTKDDKKLSPTNFEKAYKSIGYVRSGKRNPKPKEGVEFIAIFVGANGNVSHASKLLDDGRWSSKLGQGPVVAHELNALGKLYGSVVRILERRPK